jgi:hypothetical protein
MICEFACVLLLLLWMPAVILATMELAEPIEKRWRSRLSLPVFRGVRPENAVVNSDCPPVQGQLVRSISSRTLANILGRSLGSARGPSP